jgi:hypothetical protein
MLHRQYLPLAILALSGSISAAQGQPANPALRAYGYCSKTDPGMAILELSWSVPVASREAAVRDQRIEATVYRNGFNLGRYVSLTAIAAGRSFEKVANVAALAELPRALELRVAALDFAAAPAARDRASQNKVVMQIEGAAPGASYTFRLARQVGANTVTVATADVRGPICPAD